MMVPPDCPYYDMSRSEYCCEKALLNTNYCPQHTLLRWVVVVVVVVVKGVVVVVIVVVVGVVVTG